MDYWVEIIEQRRVRDPDTGSFRTSPTSECRKIEWAVGAPTTDDALEAGMAAFEQRYGERPEFYFSGVYTYDPKGPGVVIRAMPGDNGGAA
jgi:hypothetical protein